MWTIYIFFIFYFQRTTHFLIRKTTISQLELKLKPFVWAFLLHFHTWSRHINKFSSGIFSSTFYIRISWRFLQTNRTVFCSAIIPFNGTHRRCSLQTLRFQSMYTCFVTHPEEEEKNWSFSHQHTHTHIAPVQYLLGKCNTQSIY